MALRQAAVEECPVSPWLQNVRNLAKRNDWDETPMLDLYRRCAAGWWSRGVVKV